MMSKSLTKVIFNFLIPAFLTLGGIANAAEAPPALFSWSTASGLNRWAKKIEDNGGKFVLKNMTMSIFTIAYPQYEGAPGIFAWSNPATGMGNISERTVAEWYAKEDKRTGDPARLAVLILKKGIPVTPLDTYLNYSQDPPRIEKTDPRAANLTPGDNNGLILHRIINAKTSEVVIQEYILLESGYASAVVANPKFLNPIFEQTKIRLRNPLAFSRSELHSPENDGIFGFNSPKIRELAIRKIERAQQVPSENIPPFFRGDSR